MQRLLATCFITSLVTIGSLPCSGQDQWSWPEKPSNLQVLPKDWPGTRLSPVMRGFTRALGVRCPYCHVGEEGKPLSTFDFASDANPNKDRAREMLRLLGSVNGHLKKIEPSGDKRVNMWCHTCHRGRPRPMTLVEELGEKHRKSGLPAALEHYAQLKQSFYNRGAYDFGEQSLDNFGHELLKSDTAGAIQVFRLNAEQFPKSGSVWNSLGEAYWKAGDPSHAARSYKKALKIDPKDSNAQEMLRKIETQRKER